MFFISQFTVIAECVTLNMLNLMVVLEQPPEATTRRGFSPHNTDIFLYKPLSPKGYFQF